MLHENANRIRPKINLYPVGIIEYCNIKQAHYDTIFAAFKLPIMLSELLGRTTRTKDTYEKKLDYMASLTALS